MVARTVALAAAAVLGVAAPGAARAWSLTVDAWTGASHHDAMNLKQGVSLAKDDLLQGSFNASGMSVVLRFGIFETGLLWEGGLGFKSTQSGTLAPMFGLGLEPTDWLRIEGLAEVGGHRFSNIGGGSGFRTSGDTEVWVPYLGLRPGISLRLPAGPLKLVLGTWAFARRDLQKQQATVDIASGAGNSLNTYEVGGNSFGLEGRVGVEF